MREYLLVLLIAAAVTYLLGSASREAAVRLGAVAQVRDRDVHAVPIPYLGGVAMFGGLIASFLVALNLPFLSRGHDLLLSDAGIVLLGGAVVCLVGVIDDIVDLDAITKFAGQLIAAGLVTLGGVTYLWVPLPGAEIVSLEASQATLLTILVIVATTNAVNFIDGLDGLAAGVVAIGAGAFFVFAYLISVLNNLERGTPAAFLSMALVGACIGILPHNFFPARMFIGDAGALLIGFVFAGSAISMTGQYPAVDIDQGFFGSSASVIAVLLPLVPVAILIVPLGDMVLAVVRRTRAGRSPFAPDKRHMHHRLLEIGHSHRRAVLLMYLWAAVVAGGAVAGSLFTGWQSVLGLALVVLIALVLTFGVNGWRRQRPNLPT
ncbi:MAG TPA: MraY family glycosyltransferase [Nocardioidaceae bacterium]|nr:MraY family glycosyltransferase [Nocardioidaceae bacterium]